MDTRYELRNGMTVFSSDKEKLGKIVSYAGSSLIVEKGFFFPKDYEIPMSAISDVRGDDVYLLLSKDQLLSGDMTAIENRATGAEKRAIGAEKRATAAKAIGGKEEIRVPLTEEELRVRKETQQAGSVRIHKDVVAEEKTVSVPVTREVVRVERVPATGEARASASAFKEETIDVPLREERAIFDKDTVVREELRVTKDAVQEQATATETLRRETADVREHGDVQREGSLDYSKDTLKGGRKI